MFGIRRHRHKDDPVAPDLPITPMLDMSFQLLAFFVFTFQPATPPGQFSMLLPEEAEKGGGGIPNPLDPTPEKQIVMKVVIDPYQNGAQSITVTVEHRKLQANEKAPEFTVRKEDGSAEKALQDALVELQKLLAEQRAKYETEENTKTVMIKDKDGVEKEKPLVKLQLDVDRAVKFADVIALQDLGAAAGFTDISATPQKDPAEKK